MMASRAERAQRDTDANRVGEDTGASALTAAKILKRFTDANRALAEWRDATIESLRMLNNDQWDDELKAKLAEQGMAPVVINRMLMPIMYLSGVQRQTRQEPKLVAF